MSLTPPGPADAREAATTAAAVALRAFAASRQPEQFEPLVRLHLGMVRGVVYRIVLDAAETDDLVQETFIRAYRKFDSFRHDAQFSTWLCRIGINLALMSRRARPQLAAADVGRTQPSAPASPGHELVRREEHDRLDAAIATLPRKLRAVLVLATVNEMSGEEIAAALGCPRATVYWRLHQARKLLRRSLGEN